MLPPGVMTSARLRLHDRRRPQMATAACCTSTGIPATRRPAMAHDHHHSSSPAIDPVCGMTVDPANAAGSSQYGGQTIYFCSAHCKTKFDADPAKYMGEKKPEQKSTSGEWTCPMHPE